MRKEILVFSIILIICLIVSKFVFSFAFVHGDSMSPTFSDKQLIFINKIDRNYNNYDIIIFNKNDRKLIKRVVAVPGDKIVIKDNCLYVNGNITTSEQIYTSSVLPCSLSCAITFLTS